MRKTLATLVLLAVTAVSSVTVFASNPPAHSFGADTTAAVHFNPSAPSGQYINSGSTHTDRPIHFNPAVNHGGGANSRTASAISFNGNSGFAEGERIGSLTVQRINRTINVYEGATMRNMDFGAGRFAFSGANSGNTALIGHNRGRTNGFFAFVRTLQEGDLLTLDMNGIVRTYAVTHSLIVHETDFSPLMEFGCNRLTLVTCLEYRQRYRRIAVAIEILE